MNGLLNIIRREAQRVLSQVSHKRMGIVRGYDPSHYAVKVEIQPEGRMTGWIPLKSPWVGNNWGFYAPPSIGDVIEIDFLEGDKESAIAGERHFNSAVVPFPCPSGEMYLIHQSGSYIKLTNDGHIYLSASGDLRIEGNNVKIHGRQTFEFDANGQGQKWNGSSVETWQDNDTTGAHHNHAPPETP